MELKYLCYKKFVFNILIAVCVIIWIIHLEKPEFDGLLIR